MSIVSVQGLLADTVQILHFETTETCDKFVSSSRRDKHIYVIAADQNLGK